VTVRPIGARALKSVIDTLRPHLSGARVLDLFAGQGRFGTEALEEGALQVVFVEKDRNVAQDLIKALSRNKAWQGRFQVLAKDALQVLKSREGGETYDIIFADPPFPLWSPEFAEAILRLFSEILADSESLLVLKYPSRLPFPPHPGLTQTKVSEFGESTLYFLVRS
jgi:16S rRNA (guanine966-N2)-methyltransferase